MVPFVMLIYYGGMDRKLVYKKSAGTRVLGEEQPKSPVVPPQVDRVLSEPSEKIPSTYKKDDGVLSYSLICVISGGTDRERIFLNELERKHTFKSVEVIFVSTKNGGGGLTPKMMLTEYNKIIQGGKVTISGRTVKIESVDMIYMFSDVDHYENELREILDGKDSATPVWIISNPDFEIWLYYCYRNDPYEDLKEVINEVKSQRSSKLKTVNGTFNNGGGLDTRKAFEHLEDGIAHSKKHYQESGGIPKLLSTQMHLFAEEVLLRLGEEYKEFIQKKQAFRNMMKSKVKVND